jgi:DNA-binding NarL/FixJ family response regulator
MRAVICDSQPLFRLALADLVRQIEQKADIKVVGAFRDLSVLTGTGQVELLLLGWPGAAFDPASSAGGNRGSTLPEVRERFAKAAIVLVVSRCTRADCENWVRQGAAGVILRSDPPELILSSLRLVLQGGTFLPTAGGADAADDFDYPAAGQRKLTGVAEPKSRPALTPRQTMVLRLMGRGWANRQIAQELGVSEGTVKVHVNAILRALGVSNRTQAALTASRAGLSPEA